MEYRKDKESGKTLRTRLFETIFESDTRSGKAFDIALLVTILLSVSVVLLESMDAVSLKYGRELYVLEWIFTVLFTIEYILRLYSTRNALKYAFSFFGIIDLLAILPTFLSLVFVGAQSLMVIRLFRLLRVFRIFKLTRPMSQGKVLILALRSSRDKIIMFLFVVVLLVCVFGTVMYLVEGSVNPGFDSIHRSIYWCVVTVTTVGYGDISPVTGPGQFLASLLMIAGYAIIAVPTGIVTSEIIKSERFISNQTCPYCVRQGHDRDAAFCKYCGKPLNEEDMKS